MCSGASRCGNRRIKVEEQVYQGAGTGASRCGDRRIKVEEQAHRGAGTVTRTLGKYATTDLLFSAC